MQTTLFKSGELKHLQEKIRSLLTKIRLRFYVVESNEIFYEFLNYPYRLISVCDIINSKNKLKERLFTKMFIPENIILDSGIFNESIDNKLILQIATKLNPTYVVPKDYLENNKKTIESIKEFLEIKDSYLKNDNIKLLIPLQKPYEIDNAFRRFNYFAIGGVVKLSNQLKKITVKNVVSNHKDKQFHLFGVKLTTMPEIFKEYPNIVSADSAMKKYTFYNNKLPFITKNAFPDIEVYQGEFSGISSVVHTMFFILNDLVGYYNYKIKPTQKKMF